MAVAMLIIIFAAMFVNSLQIIWEWKGQHCQRSLGRWEMMGCWHFIKMSFIL